MLEMSYKNAELIEKNAGRYLVHQENFLHFKMPESLLHFKNTRKFPSLQKCQHLKNYFKNAGKFPCTSKNAGKFQNVKYRPVLQKIACSSKCHNIFKNIICKNFPAPPNFSAASLFESLIDCPVEEEI